MNGYHQLREAEAVGGRSRGEEAKKRGPGHGKGRGTAQGMPPATLQTSAQIYCDSQARCMTLSGLLFPRLPSSYISGTMNSTAGVLGQPPPRKGGKRVQQEPKEETRLPTGIWKPPKHGGM